MSSLKLVQLPANQIKSKDWKADHFISMHAQCRSWQFPHQGFSDSTTFNGTGNGKVFEETRNPGAYSIIIFLHHEDFSFEKARIWYKIS